MRPLDNAEYNPLRRQYLDGSLFHGGGGGGILMGDWGGPE